MNNKGEVPWFMAGGAKPAIAWEPNTGWYFGSNTTTITNQDSPQGKIEALSFMEWAMTDHQIAICNQLNIDGRLINGRWENWAQFCEAHGIDERM